MNKRKTLETLNKLANQLDEIGRVSEANFVDQMISKLAQQLVPIGKPYKEGDKFFQRFEDSAKGLVVKEVNPDGSLKGATPTPQDKMTPTPPSSGESWNDWFKRMFPGLLPALESKPEEAIKEQQQANQANDGQPGDKVRKLMEEIQERYNKIRGLTLTSDTDPDLQPTELMEWEDPDDLPTHMDIINNVDFKGKPDFTGEEDWADVSMWQDGKPLDNRF